MSEKAKEAAKNDERIEEAKQPELSEKDLEQVAGGLISLGGSTLKTTLTNGG